MSNRVPPRPLAESLEPRTLLAATPAPQLVKDIDPENFGSNPALIADVGGGVAYVSSPYAEDGLWRTDGTPAGTTYIGSFRGAHLFTEFGGRVYYAASPGGLYYTDGTAAGTVAVSNNQGFIYDIRAVNGHLLMLASPYGASELWTTDGTFAGTRPFRDSGGPTTFNLQSVTPTQHRLYFTGSIAGTTDRALWVTDGTPTGTVMLMRLPHDVSNIEGVVGTRGDTIYFFADDGVHGLELWQSDGTVAGTTLVTELVPGAVGVGLVGEAAAVGDRFYFVADDRVHGSELWVTDGTAGGTRLVDDALPGSDGAAPHSLRVVGNSLYFVAPVLYPDDGDADTLPQAVQQLWRTDGTAEGTVALAAVDPSQLTVVSDDTLYFTEPAPTSGQTDVARTDPSSDEVVRVASFSAATDQAPTKLTASAGRLYFVAGDSTSGVELWSTDGTRAGTRVVRDIEPGPDSSNPDLLTPVGNRLLFKANDSLHGRELFSTDGSVAGTQSVDLYTLGRGSSPVNLVTARHALFFNADPNGNGHRQLWRTDGTTAGTLPLTTTVGNPPVTPAAGTEYGSTPRGMIFSDADGNLWLVDGAADDTRQIHKFQKANRGAPPSGFKTIDGVAYFSAWDPDHGYELWRSDGTPTGTYLVADVATGPDSSAPQYLTAIGHTLYFFGFSAAGWSVWKSDGTAAGTTRVGSAGVYDPNAKQSPVAGRDGRLYYTSNDGTHGRELWVSDGTAAGTHMVADVTPGAGGAIREDATIAEAGGAASSSSVATSITTSTSSASTRRRRR